MTLTVLLNVLLALALVGALLVLLGHQGVHRDRRDRAKLLRWHRARGRMPRHVAD